jgi:hemoglobin
MNSNQKFWQKSYPYLFAALVFSGSLPAHADTNNADGCILRMAMNDTVNAGNTKKQESLYVRLGGYDAIAAVVDDLVQRLAADPKLGRFWAHRGADGIRREKQLVVDFIVDRAGGPLFYSGRDMVTSHKGMRISDEDWKLFMTYLHATLEKFKVAEQEKSDVTGFMESLKATMVE